MSSLNQYTLSGSAAEMYERNMVPAIFEPFATDLVDRANLVQGEKVLDVACGTGVVSRLAWQYVAPTGRIVGLDVNAEMLEVARGASRDVAPKIEWTKGNVSEMPISDQEFDVVLCQHGLQYFPDRSAALKEMHRVLGEQGRLTLSVWRPVKFNAGHAVFADVLEHRLNAEAAATRRAPFNLSDRNELRALVTDAGFNDVLACLTTRVARFASAEAMIRIMMAGTPLGAAMDESDPDVLQTVINEVTEGLSEFVDDLGLAIPMQAWVVTAKA